MANGEGSGLDAGSGAAVGRGLEANGEGRGLDAVGAAVLANGDGSGFVVGLLANGEGSGLDAAVLANGDGSALPPAGAIFENGEGIAVDPKFILSKIEGIFYSIYTYISNLLYCCSSCFWPSNWFRTSFWSIICK